MKVLAFTSIRADYDLMSPLYFLLHQRLDIEFKLIVSGAHLSKEYGYSVQQVEEDGFDILARIETLLHSDSMVSKLKTAAIFLQSAIERVAEYQPDLILFAGDREDVMMAALISVFLKVPSIHFYGGDHESAGHEDTQIRHAVSKLASAHFVSCEEHAQRLVAMGEAKRRIFNIGSIALDRFVDQKVLPLNAWVTSWTDQVDKPIAVLIYHPSPNAQENNDSAQVLDHQIEAILMQGWQVFVSAPNSDAGHSGIMQAIEKWRSHPDVVPYRNLSRTHFLSLFTHAKCIIGNSSAGLLESASVKVPAINVGARQLGRMAGDNVLFCGTEQTQIAKALKQIQSLEFQSKLAEVQNPYGDGRSSQKALDLILNTDWKTLQLKVEDPLTTLNIK